MRVPSGVGISHRPSAHAAAERAHLAGLLLPALLPLRLLGLVLVLLRFRVQVNPELVLQELLRLPVWDAGVRVTGPDLDLVVIGGRVIVLQLLLKLGAFLRCEASHQSSPSASAAGACSAAARSSTACAAATSSADTGACP